MVSLKEYKWNWLGKLTAILVTLIVLVVLPKALREETGILNLPKCNNWKLVIAVSAGLLTFFWSASYATRDGSLATLEYYAFQSIMPSVDEEFLYRGTVIAMLVAAFGKNYSLAGVRIGWGALPIIAFFGLLHGYQILLADGPIDYSLMLTTVFVTGVAGAGLLWIKEMTSSVWICVVMHSLMNLGNGFFNHFTP